MNNWLYSSFDKRIAVKIIFTFIPAIYLMCQHAQCQSSNLIFDHITFNEGLTTGICQNIYQDKRGYIWFGTYSGLVQYDGYVFNVFNPVQNDSNSISGTYSSTMVEDKRGLFWIGTNYGLSVYDQNSGKFYRFLHDPNNSSSLNHNYIRDLYYEEALDKLWIGTTNGLHSLDLKDIDITQPRNAMFKRFLNNPDDPSSIDNNLIRDVVKDNNNRLFVLTNGKYLNLYDNEKFSRISLGDIVDKTNKMSVVDNNNTLWISTALGYLIKCDLNTFEVQLSEPLKKINSTVYPLRKLLAIDDNLWITTEGAGLLIYNTKTGEIKNYTNNPFNPYSLSSNNLLCILQDRSGIIWLGTNASDINKYVPNKAKFGLYYPDWENGLYGKVIRAIIQGKKGNIWIGTDGDGLKRFDRKTNTYIQYKNDPQNQNSLSSNKILSLYEDHKGMLWIGTWTGGINKFDEINQKFIAYKNDPKDVHSIKDNEIRSIIEDKNYNLWVGTSIAGLAILDNKTGHFYHYTNNPADTQSIRGNKVTSLLIDSNNRLFVGTSSGVDVVDLSKVDFSTFPPSVVFKRFNSVNSNYDINNMFLDSDNNIWFCSGGGGLTKWNRVTGKSVAYSVNDGLSSDNVTAVLEDNQKKIWISSKNGLSKYDPVTNTFKNYNTFDGLQSPEFFPGCCKTNDGELFFGGTNGLNAFYPDQIKENLHKPTVVLTDLKIFNQSVKIGEKVNNRVILTQALSELKEIELSYKENYFSISFVALDYNNTRKNMYAFQMHGHDDKWIQLGNKHEATFSDLDPKEYIFKVKASNNDGIWSEEVSLRIIILPPWWKTLWFKIGVILAIIFLLLIFYRARIKSYRKRQLELTELVRERTEELQKTNEQLIEKHSHIEKQAEELRSHSENLNEVNNLLVEKQKLIQSQSEQLLENNEQLKILNATKDKFFSIIGHDLRNPFHLIFSFSQLLLEELKNLPPEKIQQYIELINTTSSRGNNLLDNLLQWAQTQTGQISFRPKTLNLLSIASDIIILMEGEALKKNISVELKIEPGILVFADENMLNTIFRNLISNGIKFTHKHGTVSINAVVDKPDVEVTVTDTGIGIPAKILKHLFQIDEIISTEGTSNETGTGLGLILCKEFVEKHNGKLWVKSEVGKGSEFKFALPLG